MTNRKLTPDDQAIWQHVAKTVNNRYKPVPLAPQSFTPDKRSRAATKPSVNSSSFSESKAGQGVRPSRRSAPNTKTLAPQMARDKRVRRGKVIIDRKVDLHDLTQDQAYSLLLQTLHSASNRGQSCVLVVTGKGSLSERPGGGGILRRMFPLWLGAPDIRPLIARYAQAHIRHGGSGAWYVFLKTQP